MTIHDFGGELECIEVTVVTSCGEVKVMCTPEDEDKVRDIFTRIAIVSHHHNKGREPIDVIYRLLREQKR